MRLKTVFILMAACLLASGMQVPASEDDTFSQGIAAFNAGRWLPAADTLQKAALEQPRDEVVHMTAGVALANVKRYPQAAQQFECAVQASPDGIIPLMLLEGTYSEMGNSNAARQARMKANSVLSSGRAFGTSGSSDSALAKSLAKYPRNAIASCLLGDSYQLQRKLESAKRQYAKAAGLAPQWAKPVFNLGLANLQTDPKTSEVNFKQAIELDPTNNRLYLWLGDAYLKQSQTGKAIEAYTRAQQDKALLAEAQTRIGNAQMQAGNYLAARQSFSMAASNAPRDPRPIAGQAQALQISGQYREAEAKYNQAGSIILQNGNAPRSQAVVAKQVADVQSAQGRLKDASSNYLRAYDLLPNLENAEALANSQKRASTLSQNITAAEAALRANPKDIQTMVYLLAAYKVQGSAQGRLDVAQKLARVDHSNRVRYFIEIATAQVALGHQDLALNALSESIEYGDSTTWEQTAIAAKDCGLLPRMAQSYEKAMKASRETRLGKIAFELYSVMDNVPDMVATAEYLTKQAPDDPSLLLRLGRAYERAGKTNEALAVYGRVALGSDAAAASVARARIDALQSGK